jgi:hypothetical protein
MKKKFKNLLQVQSKLSFQTLLQFEFTLESTQN